jgi:hypothetical protein
MAKTAIDLLAKRFGFSYSRRRASLGVLASLSSTFLTRASEPAGTTSAKRKKRRKCRAGERRCGGRCRNLNKDARHCGSCGAKCAGNARCIDGTCQGAECVTSCTASGCGRVPAECAVFPADNIWNTRIDGLPPHPDSDAFVASVGLNAGLHADFGSGLYEGRPIGIPFIRVPSSQPAVPIEFAAYEDESDPGPYPIPEGAPIEGGSCASGDRHVIVVQEGSCTLYELFNARPLAGGGWRADSGAVFDLTSHALRPAGWTSADAAGLPILPGLVRWQEIEAGAIEHALRFTASETRKEFVWPARHHAGSSTSQNVPPMGQRFRLKDEFDITGFSPENKIILNALKQYGMILSDNGSDWFLSGTPNDNWNNDDLRELREGVHGRDFEAIDAETLRINPNSGQAEQT